MQVDRKRNWTYLAAALISSGLMLTSFSATNADFFPSGIVDGILLALCFGMCFFFPFSSSFSKKEVWYIVLVALSLLLLGVRYWLAWREPYLWPGLQCGTLPSFIPKIECFLGLPFDQNHGARQMLFHISAFVAFVVAAWITRQQSARWEMLGILFSVPALIWSVYTLLAQYGWVSEPLVSSNFVGGSDYPLARRAVATNPGWLWPLLTPVFSVSMGMLFSVKSLRLVYVLKTLLLAGAILSSQQRGSYLVVVSCLVAAVSGRFYSQGSVRSIMFRFFRAFAAMSVVVSSLFVVAINDWHRPFFEYFRIPLRDHAISVSAERLRIWADGLHALAERPWFGFGAASWFHLSTEKYPTAHNLWVQMFVELGVLHATLIASLILAYVIFIFRGCRRNQSDLPVVASFLTGVMIVSLFQEVDHLNTIYYQFAVVAGLLFGRPCLTDCRVLQISMIAWPTRCILAFLSAMSLAFAVLAFFQYSWGGHAFSPQSKGFVRSFRPWGTMTAFPNRDLAQYSVVNFEEPWRPDVLLQGKQSDFSTFKVEKDHLLLKNGHKFWGRQFFYTTNNMPHQVGHILKSFHVLYPWLQTNLGIFAGRGLYAWESGRKPQRGERWCAEKCHILLKANSCRGQQRIIVGGRPDTAVKLVAASAVVSAPSDGVVWSPQSLQEEQIYELSKPNEVAEVVLGSPEESWGWEVSLQTSPPFVPSTLGTSTDARSLGVKLFDLRCIQ